MQIVDERPLLRAALETIELGDKYEMIVNREKTIFSPFYELNSLDLSGMQIKAIPSEFFSQFKNLFAIDLSQNHLLSLDDTLFHRNRKLREIYLSGNNLQSLPEKIFRNALHLQILDLGENCIEKLPPGLFQRLRNLRKLVLKDNRLKSLPDSFKEMKNLGYLDLSGNNFPEPLNRVLIDESSVQDFLGRNMEALIGE